ncbi:ErfK/YbiS/YcfS/YnhG family protein [Thermovirga lienii DSM 17291]|jgi:lipoprotein-anchoring transpeptidase ErfK/SrfK|uniref:ErfK/YbiS/YcfS/YnhG family protein n=1 Tax=Thermovirga lienii (strain ATCC BAA-1197 / DSM 17291 / Cas60314) TaxID=580340 RepID=G7V6M3_THELD|nr:L,D-transpeptidase [Thermovirga lienii]AER67136.1 ErfK/YbiS/YcfS/YnhG family protein [Thermovirga lienii DSM 17291]KUK42476.1 MAG: ErfK/YbiS/YcfS/YnhG family protein [Thermovirga lienii]HCD71379.1 L,D-transpeptidase [Thermovirga lienii]
MSAFKSIITTLLCLFLVLLFYFGGLVGSCLVNVGECKEASASSSVNEFFNVDEAVQANGLEGKKWILVRKRDFTLTLYDGKVVLARYPVAIGKNDGDKREEGDMRTPEGIFSVVSVEDSRHWVHDFGDGKGPIAGAYGPYFIRLKTPPHKGIGIHGTHDPASIGTKATEGCIRLRNQDLLELVKNVTKGMTVIIAP